MYTLSKLEDLTSDLSVRELEEAIEDFTGQSLDGTLDHMLYDENNIPCITANTEQICEEAFINCEEFYNHLMSTK